MSVYSLNKAVWKDYELIDSGDFEKLERFGQMVLWRPEPQAVWSKQLPLSEWKKRHHVRYIRSKTPGIKLTSEKGIWEKTPKAQEEWPITYHGSEFHFKLKLQLTSFGHVGLFPEQSDNWEYIYKQVKAHSETKPKVLNLFAYTGGASLAAAAGGAFVSHLDSIKKTVTWANQNRQLNDHLPEMRWVVEDALAFVKREARRGNKYHGIILDPPAYGRGPKGEKWVLEEQVDDLVKSVAQILEEECFVVLNLYSMGLSAVIIRNLVRMHIKGSLEIELGENVVPSSTGAELPLGTFLRVSKKN
ncbi:class I SAM-dependent methyltransferase [Persicobacter psychrovividus]|uniref:SAM-dependent methyltransferase n=1 Tax=Persicobacter psychrovividus TaxID=387638 RepID=A0ABN6LJC2_9BACT|nr:SAM-dependent methyltransferase [Persicobacter psychrovividus]